MTGRVNKVLAISHVDGQVEELKRALDASTDADAVAVIGDLGVEWGSRPATYREIFKTLGEAEKPTFWVPGRWDAPLRDYLKESYSMEVVYPCLHGVHGSFAYGPGAVLFAGFGGEIADDPDTLRAEEMMLRYPGWEAEYRLKMLDEVERRHTVMLFATPPEHKGLEREGSAVVAELVKTHRPTLVVVAGEEPGEEELGTALVVCPGRLADGQYALIDLSTNTTERRELSRAVRR